MSHSSWLPDINIDDITEDSQLAAKIEEYYRDDSTTKIRLSRAWVRNHLFQDGHQWIAYFRGRGWDRIPTNANNKYVPRPVTNMCIEVHQTLKSNLTRNKPRSTVRANSVHTEDVQAARLAEAILEAKHEDLRLDEAKDRAASIALTYGTVIFKDFWDTSGLKKVRLPIIDIVDQPVTEMQPVLGPDGAPIMDETGEPAMQEQQVLDDLGEPVTEEVEEPVIDPETGEPAYKEVPLGDVGFRVLEPFRFAIDPLAYDLYDASWCMEYAVHKLPWLKKAYAKSNGPGYTGKVDGIEPDKVLNFAMGLWYGQKSQTHGLTSGLHHGLIDTKNAIVVKEYYEQPSPDHERGRMIVVANGEVLYKGDSPYYGENPGDWHPYSDFRWEIMPGRYWAKGAIDDIIPLQQRLNQIDSASFDRYIPYVACCVQHKRLSRLRDIPPIEVISWPLSEYRSGLGDSRLPISLICPSRPFQ